MGNADRLTKTTKEKIMSNLTTKRAWKRVICQIIHTKHLVSQYQSEHLKGQSNNSDFKAWPTPKIWSQQTGTKESNKQETSERSKFCKLFRLYVVLSVSPKNSNPQKKKNNCLQMLDVSLLLFLLFSYYYYCTCWWWNVLFFWYC